MIVGCPFCGQSLTLELSYPKVTITPYQNKLGCTDHDLCIEDGRGHKIQTPILRWDVPPELSWLDGRFEAMRTKKPPQKKAP